MLLRDLKKTPFSQIKTFEGKKVLYTSPSAITRNISDEDWIKVKDWNSFCVYPSPTGKPNKCFYFNWGYGGTPELLEEITIMSEDAIKAKVVFDVIRTVNLDLSKDASVLIGAEKANLAFKSCLERWNDLPKYVYTTDYFYTFALFVRNIFNIRVPNDIDAYITMLLHHETTGTPYFKFPRGTPYSKFSEGEE